MTEFSRPSIQIRIRDLRRERSLTQEELAEALGISRQSINAMEAGRCLPSLPVALQIASFFSVPVQVVFADLEDVNEGGTILPIIPERATLRLLPSGGPSINLWETESQFKLEIRLPGFEKEMINLEAGKDFLQILGKADAYSVEGIQLMSEFSRQDFDRMVLLPSLIDPEKVEAKLENGILYLSLSKVLPVKPLTARIEIKNS
jgi:HSP20 family molecular chaperone IbpA/DNA-binding XRE family transcriptional regulator